jgi:hypothetical protein
MMLFFVSFVALRSMMALGRHAQRAQPSNHEMPV